MIVQAIGLLDDLDKEVNTYAMRVKEWFGWHFPEMAKVVVDNLQYAKVVIKMRNRVAAANTDFSDILASEVRASWCGGVCGRVAEGVGGLRPGPRLRACYGV